MQERPIARILYLLVALSAGSGLVIAFLIAALDAHPPPLPPIEPTLFGIGTPGWDGAPGRLADLASYFTEWSNIIVCVVFLLLAIRPHHRGTVFRVLLIDALLMILITGVVYLTVIAPNTPPRDGWNLASSIFQHYLTPLLTLLAWAIVGPRGWFSWRLIPLVLIIPLSWAAFTLIRGVIIHVYPYAFVDVPTLGYPMVILNIIGITMLGVVIYAGLLGIDRFAPRWTPA